MDNDIKFICDKCGVCCIVAVKTGMVPKNEDGTACKFLTEDNLCSIYNDRPNFCDVNYMIKFVYKNNGLSIKEGIKDTVNLCKEVRRKLLCGKQYQQ